MGDAKTTGIEAKLWAFPVLQLPVNPYKRQKKQELAER
jgi:hypothetical protein